MRAVGLPELVTTTLSEYQGLAVRLASDRKHLSEIKFKLTNGRAEFPLFNTERFTRHIESAFTIMWEHYMRGKPPECFSVQPGCC